MSEQATAVRTRDTTCPACRCNQFVATTTWWRTTENGAEVKRRARKCRKCDYVDNETVPLPIRDADQQISAETTNRGTSDDNHVE